VTVPVPEAPEPVEQTMGPTGHPVVDAVLDELDAAEHRDPADQVAAYEQAHKTLSQTLAGIDQS
jgi:hypothetical protein